MGSLVVDSPDASALLTGLRLVRVDGDAITIRLLAPAIGDAFVTLHRGERQCHVQHGSTRPPLVTATRRIRWIASPAPAGWASTGLVQEVPAAIDGFPRFVASLDAVAADAGAFSVTAASVTTARFGAVVGTYADRDGPEDMHGQLGDSSRRQLVVTTS